MHATADGGIETCVADDAEPERRRRSFEAIEERVKQLHGTIDVDAATSGTRVVGDAARRTRRGARFRADGDGTATCSSSGRPPATRCARWTASCPQLGHEFDEDGRTLVDQQDRRLAAPGRRAPLRVLRRQALEPPATSAASSAAARPSTSACARPLA